MDKVIQFANNERGGRAILKVNSSFIPGSTWGPKEIIVCFNDDCRVSQTLTMDGNLLASFRYPYAYKELNYPFLKEIYEFRQWSGFDIEIIPLKPGVSNYQYNYALLWSANEVRFSQYGFIEYMKTNSGCIIRRSVDFTDDATILTTETIDEHAERRYATLSLFKDGTICYIEMDNNKYTTRKIDGKYHLNNDVPVLDYLAERNRLDQYTYFDDVNDSDGIIQIKQTFDNNLDERCSDRLVTTTIDKRRYFMNDRLSSNTHDVVNHKDGNRYFTSTIVTRDENGRTTEISNRESRYTNNVHGEMYLISSSTKNHHCSYNDDGSYVFANHEDLIITFDSEGRLVHYNCFPSVDFEVSYVTSKEDSIYYIPVEKEEKIGIIARMRLFFKKEGFI